MSSTSRFVFISYARSDGTPFAQQLWLDLKNAGHEPWMDTEELASHGGEPWEDVLTDGLLSADLVIVVLTPGAVASPVVRGEFSKAQTNSLTVVPALFLDCDVPLSLVGLQHVDFRKSPADGLANLRDQLERLSDPAAEIARDKQMLERLKTNRQRAARRGVETAALDRRIAAVQRRIDEFSADVDAQLKRVSQGPEEERQRAAAEAARPSGPGVRRYGRHPPLGLGDTFHDRVEQQQSIIDALLEPKTRMVTVLGRGGMGKTALACRVLSTLEGVSLSDGRVLQGIAVLHHTPTEPITLIGLLRHVAQVLPDVPAAQAKRVIDNGDLSSEVKVDTFLELIPSGLIVALLDNFEDLLDERGRIRDADVNLFIRRVLTGTSGVRLLITARAAINLPAVELRAERQIILRDGLPVEDAVALLREIDPNNNLELASASAAELKMLVDKTYGIPRALELLANALKSDDGSTLLSGLNEVADDFWTRETIVERLVEVNYRKLRPEARRVAEALAVYARPVGRVAVDFLLLPHVPGLRLEEVLQPLVNARLVSVERGRNGAAGTLGLHRIDRDFLYQRLPAEGSYSRPELHRRAAEFYRTQRTVTARGWRDVTELEPQVFEYRHLVQAAEYDAAAILLGEYASAIAHCGHPTACRDLFNELPDRLTSDRARVHYLMTALIWKAALGPISDGLPIGEQALQLALTVGDSALELQVRAELVTAYRYANDSSRSREHAEQMAERLRQLSGTDANQASIADQVAFDLVLARTYQGDIQGAQSIAQPYLERARRSGQPRELAMALNAQVVVSFAAGRYVDAAAEGREAEALWQPGFNDGLAYVQNLVGMALYQLGDYPAAVAKLAEAVTTADEWDSPRPEAIANWNLSIIHLLHGVYDAALDHGRQADVLMTRLSLDRFSHAPLQAAEAAKRNDQAGVARALLTAAKEWMRCSDLFSGPTLTARARDIARLGGLAELAAEAEALDAQLRARQKLPPAPS